MQKVAQIILVLLSGFFLSCENEVDLNADFEDTTVVYALINPYESIHYVKVNRAYIEENANAIDLAANPDNFFYESLEVKLVLVENGQEIPLRDTLLPKEPGLFSTEKNVAYYTTANLQAPKQYDLIITQPDGKVTSARFTTLTRTSLVSPRFIQGRRAPVSFIDQRGQYQNEEFEIRMTPEIAEAEVSLNFYYTEINGLDSSRRVVNVPVGGIRNTELSEENFTVVFDGESFYRNLGRLVPDNGLKKIIPIAQGSTYLEVIITAVDPIFTQYAQIYGPLDGLAQVRPEFTNVENGVGLVASRSTTNGSPSYFTRMTPESETQLLNGQYTRGLNFSYP